MSDLHKLIEDTFGPGALAVIKKKKPSKKDLEATFTVSGKLVLDLYKELQRPPKEEARTISFKSDDKWFETFNPSDSGTASYSFENTQYDSPPKSPSATPTSGGNSRNPASTTKPKWIPGVESTGSSTTVNINDSSSKRNVLEAAEAEYSNNKLNSLKYNRELEFSKRKLLKLYDNFNLSHLKDSLE